MVSFTRAPTVAPGDRVDSSHLATLATAFNDRLRSGLGDPTWRIRFMIASAFRQMRNPDSSGFLWPAQHEFFTAYQMRPLSDGDWPDMGPGDPEGSNLSNPINAWVWGHEAMGVDNEAGRLAAMPWDLDGRVPSTPSEIWLLGKKQRGGVDVEAGVVGCPAWDAARSWAGIRYSRYSPHANAYGGWLPTPTLGTDCYDPDPTDMVPAPPNYQILFTALSEEASTAGFHHASTTTNDDGFSVIHYAGTCWAVDTDGDGTIDYQDHIYGIASTPWAYYIVMNSGDVDVLPTNEWVEGPYTGNPWLSKTDAQVLPRIMNAFSAEFRGDEQQIAASESARGRTTRPTKWNSAAFDVGRFLSSQYLLAPARGASLGNGEIESEYPLAAWRPQEDALTAAKESLATFETGGASGTVYPVHSGFVVAGLLARAESLSDPVTIQCLIDGEVAAAVTLTPSSGAADELLWLSTPAEAGQEVSVRLATEAAWTDVDGFIEVELAELYQYKPDLSDLFLALRVSGALTP